MNYICAPDLFRYCANSNQLTLDYVLGNASVYTTGQNVRTNQGIYGRVPKYLFKHLTAVQKLSNVFYLNLNITPYTWNDETNSGMMIHPDTLYYNKSLLNVSGLFAGIHVPAKIVIPATLFTGNTQLQNASYLFYGAIFSGPYSDVQQLPDGLFSSNKLLTNISYMFAATSTNHPSTNNNIKYISGTLFTPAHSRITNVSNFMYLQGSTHGTVPAMWEWLRPTTANRSNVFYGVRKSYITNSDAIVAAGWGEGMI
jgi:hypothetical protein